MTKLATNSAGDGRGHGTFVGGIAAGRGDGYAGALPNAPLVSIDVMHDRGMAMTSDVIAAAQLRLAEALATVAAELPNARRLLLLEPEHAHRIRAEARAAIAEISDRTLEAEIDRDTYTHGFAWARRRRRAIDERIDARQAEPVPAEPARHAA